MNKIQCIIKDPKRLAPAIPVALSMYFIFSSFSRPVITIDGQTYLQIARNIHSGIGLGWQASWVPPLYSCLVAFVGCLPGVQDLLLSSAIVGALMGVFLVVAVWLLAEEVFGFTAAFGASLVTALFPHFLWISKVPEAECTYTAFLVFSLWLFCVALRKQSLVMYTLSGIVFSVTYLARSEGFLVMVFVVAAVLVTESRRLLEGRMLHFTAVLLVSFFVFSLPYLIFLKRHYGAWVISPKSTYVLIWMKSNIYHDNDYGEKNNENLWGLTENGKLKWQVPSGIGDLIDYLMSHPEKSIQVYLNNLKMEIPGNTPNNSGMEKYPQVLPEILALAAAASVFRRWGNRSARNKAVLMSPFLILFVLPVFTTGWWKYLIPYSPLMIILGCAGITFTANSLLKRFPHTTGRNASLVAIIILAVNFRLMAFPIHLFSSSDVSRAAAPQHSAEIKARLTEAVESEEAGRWIADKLGPGHNYMVSWSKLIYHLNGLWTATPLAGYEKRHAYAISQGAEYFLVETDGSLTLKEITPEQKGLRFETMYRSPLSSYTVIVYRFMP